MSGTYTKKTEGVKKTSDRIIGRGAINRFGERLKTAMDGMSNVELARRSGLSETTVRKYLTGKIYPGIDKLAAVADACNVSMTWLLVGDTPKSEEKFDLTQGKDEEAPQERSDAEGVSEMLSFLLKRLPHAEQNKLAEQLIRKGIETLTLLNDDDALELLSLSGEAREIALNLKSLPAARLREIYDNLSGDERAAPLTGQPVGKVG